MALHDVSAGPAASSDVVQVASGAGSVRIPYFAGSPDIPLGGGSDDEFDTTDTSDPLGSWTTIGSPTTQDINSTIKSHYYIACNANASASIKGIMKTASPPFTVVAKMSDFAYRSSFNMAGLVIASGTDASGGAHTLTLRCNGNLSPHVYVDPWTNATSPGGSLHEEAGPSPAAMPSYFAAVVNSSDDVDWYFSHGGMMFSLVGSNTNPSYTVGAYGLMADAQNGSFGVKAAFDWIRFYTPLTVG